MLIGLSIERGLFPDVETPVADLLGGRQPRLHRDSRKDSITVEQLLMMTSCLDCNDWDLKSPGNEERMYPTSDWVQFALDLPVRRGCDFSYCTAGVVLLGVALETTLGEPLSSFAQRELFSPLGIERAQWQHTPRGETSNAGGLGLTTQSLLRLGLLYQRGGEGIVPAGWVRRSIQRRAQIDAQTDYGYLWWIRSFAGHSSFFMTGMGGNRVHVFPDLELVAAITTTNFRRRDAHALSDRLVIEQILA